MKLSPVPALFLLALALLAPPFRSTAPLWAETAEQPAIRVVVDDNYPPYAFRDQDGQIRGIIPDQWKEWSKVTGREIRLMPMQWDQCLSAIQSGEADVIDSLFWTPAREWVFDFLPPYATIRVPVFIHESISGIAAADDLRGFPVAVKRGDACIDALKAWGIKDFVEYPDYESIVRAARDLEVRVFCVDEPPALYYLYKLGADHSFKRAFTLYQGEFHRAVLKRRQALADGSDLYTALTKGFQAIAEERYAEINRRWLGDNIEKRLSIVVLWWLGGGLGALFILLILFSFALRRQVAWKTRELSQKALQLEASERKNRAFIEALPDLFFVLDRQGRYLEYKTSDPDFTANATSALMDKTPQEIGVSPAIQKVLDRATARAFREGGMVVEEYEYASEDGMMAFEVRVTSMGEDKVLAIIRDMTARKVVEENIRNSLKEKEILIKEVHHRVKNNMQVISSLIQLQAGSMLHEEDIRLLEETQQRIKTMAQIHERLYRSDDLASIEIAGYIREIVEDLQDSYIRTAGAASIHLDLDPWICSLDQAVPLGLFVNEAVSNAFKYAYAGTRQGRLEVSFKILDGGERLLCIYDDGPGLPKDWEEKADATLGLTLIQQLARQLRGKLSMEGDGGTRIRLVF